jgi:ABC-2 type transport system permease protein
MSTSPPPATPNLPATSNLLRVYALEARSELLKLLRLPAFAIPTLAFPLVFYSFFGLAFGSGRSAGPVDMGTYLLATFGCFGVIGAALFGFGVGVASERGQGWMLLKRATPMPPFAYFFAKIFMALLFAGLIVGGLFTLGSAVGGIRLPPATWLSLAGVLITGALPFCAFGLALGYLCGPNSAPAVINIVYLPMAIVSGLWMPVQVLPGFLQKVAPWLPAYHYSQLALGTLGAGSGPPAAQSLLYLLVFSALALGVAYLAYRRDDGATFG